MVLRCGIRPRVEVEALVNQPTLIVFPMTRCLVIAGSLSAEFRHVRDTGKLSGKSDDTLYLVRTRDHDHSIS